MIYFQTQIKALTLVKLLCELNIWKNPNQIRQWQVEL